MLPIALSAAQKLTLATYLLHLWEIIITFVKLLHFWVLQHAL